MMERNKTTVVFYDQAKQIWREMARNGGTDDLSYELTVHKKLLQFFQVGDNYYFVFNIKEGDFEYISPEIAPMLGYDPQTLRAGDFLANIHMEDQPYFLAFEDMLNKFLREQPEDKLMKYKVRYDFRIRDARGNYKRLLHQLMIIQHDDQKKPLRSLGVHTDITYLKVGGEPTLSFIGLEGEPSYYNVKPNMVLRPSKPVLTRRETEILKLIVEGRSSDTIAANLFISRNTVNVHRRHILAKSETTSLAELVGKAIREGWV